MNSHHRKLFDLLLWLSVLLFVTACGGTGQETEASPTPIIETVVVTETPENVEDTADTAEEAPAAADAPVLQAPTAEPGQPTMTALVDLNVRTGPGTNYPVVGALRAGTSALIVGRSPSGFWWKIECPPGAGTECWSSAGAQYSTATDATGVAVAAVPPPPPSATHTPTVPATAGAASSATATATTTQAATQAGASPTPTYTPTPTTEGAPPPSPTPTYTPTPTTEGAPPPSPTPTATATATATEENTQVAAFDNDSLQNPAVSVFLSPTGNRNFTYSNDVSYANGDQEDWVEFEFPNNANTNQTVRLTLSCTIAGSESAQLRATIWEDGVRTNEIAICNQDEQQLTVDNTKVQQVQIHFGITDEGIYATYTLTVVGFN
jgi:hypothetical protein